VFSFGAIPLGFVAGLSSVITGLILHQVLYCVLEHSSTLHYEVIHVITFSNDDDSLSYERCSLLYFVVCGLHQVMFAYNVICT
jgi:hypothetical protein